MRRRMHAVAKALAVENWRRLAFGSARSCWDLAGDYPLKMKVVGILAASNSADDGAVFVDLKTQWVIEGFGHGHQDLESE